MELEFLDEYLKLLHEDKIKISVKHPGMLEVPEDKDVNELPLNHFKDIVKTKGWEEVSKALINLKVWNKKSNPRLSAWADRTQERLAKWVEEEREKNPEFGD